MARISKWIESSRGELVYDVAARSLQVRLDAVEHYLPLAVQSAEDDIEYVHQLRVWTRRATSAIRLYRDLIPWTRSGRVKKLLSQIRRSANDARDDDVLILRIQQDENESGAARLLEHVRSHRQKSQRPLVKMFGRMQQGEKLQREVKKLLKRTRERAAEDKLKSTRFGRWARKNLRPYVEQFLYDGQADMEDVESLHQFRISVKKLRYTMELLAGAFPPRFTKQIYPRVETLQERLGEINDCATAQNRYQRWTEETDDDREIEYLQKLLKVESESLEARRVAFLKWWTPKRMDRFATVFDDVIRRTNGKRRGSPLQAVASK